MKPRRDQPNCGAVPTRKMIYQEPKLDWKANQERAVRYLKLGYSAWKVAEICNVSLETAKFLKVNYD